MNSEKNGLDMNGKADRAVTRALDGYAEALRSERLSSDLERRLEASIESWAAEHRSRSVLRRPLPWVIAAASVAVITGGIALLAAGERNSDGGDTPAATTLAASDPALPQLDVGSVVSPLATGGQVSLFPAEGAVFRVKANLASAVLKTSGQEAEGERQYWVDVRIANDGTMRIMQVLPAERSRVVPLE
jgi:hypothetical protein